MIAKPFDIEHVTVAQLDLAHVTGDLQVALHRPAERGDLAARRDTGVDHLLHAVDVGSKTGHDDAAPVLVADDVAELLADHAFGLRVAVDFRVRGVAHQQSDAVVLRQCADLGEIGGASVDRGEIELPVTRMHDHALRCVEGDRHRVGHRVRDRDHLDVECADGPAFTVDQRVERGAAEQAGLLDAPARQVQRELGGIERERNVAQKVREPTDVILMSVGQDRAVDAVGVVTQVREVRQDEIDARHIGVGKHQPHVDQHQPAVDLDGAAVATDLAEATEEDDAYGSVRSGAHRRKRLFRKCRDGAGRTTSATHDGNP